MDRLSSSVINAGQSQQEDASFRICDQQKSGMRHDCIIIKFAR